jgi:hypothetical protein
MALIYFIPDLKGSYLILSLQKGIIGYYLLSSSSLLLTLFGVWWGSPHLSSSGYTWLWWGFYSSRIFDGDMAQSTSFNSGGGFSSHSFSLPSGGDFSSPATVAVLVCPLWWSISCGIVHSHSYHSAVV